MHISRIVLRQSQQLINRLPLLSPRIESIDSGQSVKTSLLEERSTRRRLFSSNVPGDVRVAVDCDLRGLVEANEDVRKEPRVDLEPDLDFLAGILQNNHLPRSISQNQTHPASFGTGPSVVPRHVARMLAAVQSGQPHQLSGNHERLPSHASGGRDGQLRLDALDYQARAGAGQVDDLSAPESDGSGGVFGEVEGVAVGAVGFQEEGLGIGEVFVYGDGAVDRCK